MLKTPHTPDMGPREIKLKQMWKPAPSLYLKALYKLTKLLRQRCNWLILPSYEACKPQQ